jgi:hypothetical protein
MPDEYRTNGKSFRRVMGIGGGGAGRRLRLYVMSRDVVAEKQNEIKWLRVVSKRGNASFFPN